MNSAELIDLDLRHLWHPCSQMHDYEKYSPLHIASAEGALFRCPDGREVIDGISSWWCKSLGHRHPEIRAAVNAQLDKFEHVILANTTNETIVRLSAALAGICPGLSRVFYADNGSTSVEIAMKMSLQSQAQSGRPDRKRFMSLQNGYHGESILTLAAGDCEIFSRPYAPVLPKVNKLEPLVYCGGPGTPGWDKYPEPAWRELERLLEQEAGSLAAILFEPVVQGAGGMKIYSPDLLRHLRAWADKHRVHLIADEIMTGFGRCGRMMACEYAGIVPDLVCFSKGMTAGWGPMAATLCTESIYQSFYGNWDSGKAFMHSNTYTGYPLAAAAALAAIEIYERDKFISGSPAKTSMLRSLMENVSAQTGVLANVRAIGYIAAADIVNPETGKPFAKKHRAGFTFGQEAIRLGAFLRPIGDTIYFLPPFNASDGVLTRMAEIAEQALDNTLGIIQRGGAK